jgi:hypothetical protein
MGANTPARQPGFDRAIVAAVTDNLPLSAQIFSSHSQELGSTQVSHLVRSACALANRPSLPHLEEELVRWNEERVLLH